MQSVFGKDNFFLEAQLMDRENNPEQQEMTDMVRSIAEQSNCKMLCTPDAHYCRQEDSIDQEYCYAIILKLHWLILIKNV